jgi:hypothetical protein
MRYTRQGIIRGKIIELSESIPLPDGQKLVVSITEAPIEQVSAAGNRYPPGSRALNWTEQDDQILAELYRQRQADTGREIPK